MDISAKLGDDTFEIKQKEYCATMCEPGLFLYPIDEDVCIYSNVSQALKMMHMASKSFC